MEQYLSEAMIPLLMTVILGYYSFRLLVLHDVAAIRGKEQKKLKNEEKYAREAGKLMLFLALGSLIMAILIHFNPVAAIAVIVLFLIVFGLLWRKMDQKYGE